MSTVLIKSYTPPPFSEKEALRYAGVKSTDEVLRELLRSCLSEAEDAFTYKVCYTELSADISGDVCDFGIFRLKSAKLARNLSDCGKIILFAATVGLGIDRLIMKHSRLSPARAVILDAVGTERIEALCDLFCSEIGKEHRIRPRFSPGYGDLSIEAQREIFDILDAQRHIGISLNGSLMMSPTKSVTAIVGIEK